LSSSADFVPAAEIIHADSSVLDSYIMLGFEDLAVRRKHGDYIDRAGRGSPSDHNYDELGVPNGSLIARKLEVEHAVRHIEELRKREFRTWRAKAEL
jgi:hypothetical protein